MNPEIVKKMFNFQKKMKNFVWLPLSMSLIFAFSSNGQVAFDECKIIPISESSFNKSINADKNVFIDKMQIIEKQNSKIVFPLDNNKTIELEDSNDSIALDIVNYKSIGYLKSFNSYLVEVTYLIGSENWLISKYDGEIIKLLRYFYPSPIDSLIITYDLPENDEYNGIKVLKICKNGFETLCDIHSKEWYPSDVFWKSKNEFIIKAISIESSCSENLYYKVNLGD